MFISFGRQVRKRPRGARSIIQWSASATRACAAARLAAARRRLGIRCRGVACARSRTRSGSVPAEDLSADDDAGSADWPAGLSGAQGTASAGCSAALSARSAGLSTGLSAAGFAARSPFSAAASTCAARIAAIGAAAGSVPVAAVAAGAAPAAASRAAARSFLRRAQVERFLHALHARHDFGFDMLRPARVSALRLRSQHRRGRHHSSSAFFAAACSAARRLAGDTFTSSFGTVRRLRIADCAPHHASPPPCRSAARSCAPAGIPAAAFASLPSVRGSMWSRIGI